MDLEAVPFMGMAQDLDERMQGSEMQGCRDCR